MSDQPTICIAGALARKPHEGGHTWVFLQYLLGLRRLGWNVLFLDSIESDFAELPRAVGYFKRTLEEVGLGEKYSLLIDGGKQTIGLGKSAVLDRVRSSAALINFMGYLKDKELLGAARKRVFFDIDPGFGQMWKALDLADIFPGHDQFVTIGLNLGREDCVVPTCGHSWISTWQPVVLEHWPAVPTASNGPFTSIAAWRGPYAPVEFGGKQYGLRVHEFRKFMELPQRVRGEFQLALDIDPADERDRIALEQNGWKLLDPRRIARNPAAYQRFIRESSAEFMVAKNMYVQSRSGWFSDRSICYLASGRPVLAQDTGLNPLIRNGVGLVLFKDIAEAAAGAVAIRDDYLRHSREARAIAEEYFDSDVVLRRLLRKLSLA